MTVVPDRVSLSHTGSVYAWPLMLPLKSSWKARPLPMVTAMTA